MEAFYLNKLHELQDDFKTYQLDLHKMQKYNLKLPSNEKYTDPIHYFMLDKKVSKLFRQDMILSQAGKRIDKRNEYTYQKIKSLISKQKKKESHTPSKHFHDENSKLNHVKLNHL